MLHANAEVDVVIDTGLRGCKQGAIMDSLMGQISDGKWENSPAMDKYWRNLEFYRDGDRVMLAIGPMSKASLFGQGKTDGDVLSWLAGKVKAVVKDEKEYYGTEWKRDNGTPTELLGDWKAKGVITVGDCYKVYDVLKGRRLDNKSYAESTEEEYLKAVEEYEKVRG